MTNFRIPIWYLKIKISAELINLLLKIDEIIIFSKNQSFKITPFYFHIKGAV